jgi:Domain of unknown function (DUF4382)
MSRIDLPVTVPAPVLSGRRCAMALLVLSVLLAGCEGGRFTGDLATDAPADPGITQIQVSLLGLEFRTSDGANPTLEFSSGEPLDLLDLVTGEPLRLFTSEQLPAGTYSGVRLLFDESADATVVDADGLEFPVLFADGAFAPVDFAVEDNDRDGSSESLTLMLDLRQSLAFDSVNDEYQLIPHLRAVRTGDAARIEGGVAVACPVDGSLTQGGAVYLFSGRDVTPDDIDGTGVEPLATTRVVGDTLGGQFSYALRFLAPGEYTLALTCFGDVEAADADDDLQFQNVTNVEPGDGEVLRVDLVSATTR